MVPSAVLREATHLASDLWLLQAARTRLDGWWIEEKMACKLQQLLFVSLLTIL